jgi:hypothetical protein
LDEVELGSPFLPQNISELLPKSDQDFKVTFIAVGPKLLDALMEGKNIVEASHVAGISEFDAVKLLASPEFNRLKEAYLSIGDLESRAVRVRIAKSILAAQIASGVTFRKREPMDILEYVRREQDTGKGGTSVSVFIKNTNVPRPYNRGMDAVQSQLRNGIEDTAIVVDSVTAPSPLSLREQFLKRLEESKNAIPTR